MNNTFVRHSSTLLSFIESILEKKPDYIVPVKKKGCKLLRYAKIERPIFEEKVRYLDFFENSNIDLKGKKIAVLDDATKYTSSLKNYRDIFEARGATVETYSFVGQEMIRTGEREKYDAKAKIGQFLEEATYQEYIVQQSSELSSADCFFDIDHFAIKFRMSNESFDRLVDSLDRIGEIALTNDVYTPKKLQKLCIYNIGFDAADDLFPSCISQGVLQKIRIAYNYETNEITVVPLSFPKWNSNTENEYSRIFKNVHLVLPYSDINHISDSGIFFNIVYVYQLYLLRYFLNAFSDFREFRQFSFIDLDMIAFVGNEQAHMVFNSASKFIYDTSLEMNHNPNLVKDLIVLPRKGDSTFPSVISIMRELREKYNELVAAAHTLLDVRYFISYEEMFERYTGRENLFKWIDILCDRGALVSRNYSEDGIYYRACRSGEVDPDHIIQCTAALFSLAINCCATKKTSVEGKEFVRINSYYLNKLLANFGVDYPAVEYDMHSMYTKPHNFGPLVYVEDSINDQHGEALYNFDGKDFFAYDDYNKEFVSASLENEGFEADVHSRIGRMNSVPAVEVTLYFSYLETIRNMAKKDSVLNELAICRNKYTYYEHVMYNLNKAYECIGYAERYYDVIKCEQRLREAARNINSAKEKLRYNQEKIIEAVKNANDSIVYKQTRERILRSFIPFDDKFKGRIVLMNELCLYENVLVNLLLFKECVTVLYFERFQKLLTNISDYKSFFPTEIAFLNDWINDKLENDEAIELSNEAFNAIDVMVKELTNRITAVRKQLPAPSSVPSSQRISNTKIATNKANLLIRDYSYKMIVFVAYTYSIFENSSDTQYTNIVETIQRKAFELAETTRGELIFGATGNENFGLFVTDSIADAFDFSDCLSKEITTLGNVVIKFGCSAAEIGENQNKIIRSTLNQSLAAITSHGFVLSEQGMQLAKKYTTDEFCNKFKEISMGEMKAYKYEEDADKYGIKVSKSNENTDITIGIITVLLEEYTAMRAMMENPEKWKFPGRGPNHQFDLGKIRSKSGAYHNIALARMSGAGTNNAAIRAANMINHFPNLKIIFMVGIAGGTPVIPSHFNELDSDQILEQHVRLGDIVVGDSIIQYDYVKRTFTKTIKRGKNIPPSATVIQAKQNLDYLAEISTDPSLLPWNQYTIAAQKELRSEYLRPNPDKDILHDYNGDIVEHPIDPSRTVGFPKVFSGKIASANTLLKDRKLRDALKKQEGVLAVEMETSGIADTTWQEDIGYYAVRGIVDYCDSYKDNTWHKYSALIAAAYTKSLIEFIPI